MLSLVKKWLADEVTFKLSDWEVKKEISTLTLTFLVSILSSFFIDKDGVAILTLCVYIGLKYLQRGAHHA